MSPPNSTGNSKKGTKKATGNSTSAKPPYSTAGASSKSASKRSASAALADDDTSAAALSKRAKRNTSGKKSLREEELGVGGELAEEDMIETGEEGAGAEEDDEEEDEGDEGDGGVTRCVCGEDNEEMASGLMIQCDTCKCWQHGPCVGLWDEKECPNRYFCELCKPNLHGPGGLLRKVNRKSSAPARGRSPSAGLSAGTKPHASTSASAAKPRESAEGAAAHSSLAHEPPERERERDAGAKPAAAGPSGHGPEPKKRSTMNSRDAAYDDAIALSILEAGSAAMRARLERGGKVEGEGVGDESDEEVVEEIVIGPGRGRKKSASAAERAERGAKSGGAKKGAAGASKKGGKGKSAGPSRGRRSHSKSEAESPAPHESADVEPKLEGIEDVDETADALEEKDASAAAAHDGEGEEVEGEMGPPGKKRRLSLVAADEEKKADDAAAESQVTEQSEEPATQEEQVVEPPARSPSPHPVPIHHHGGARAKHPNQYTYRPKNGQPATSRAPKSPVKRSHAGSSSHAASETNGRGGGGAASHSHGASTATFGWGMPEHLKHLAHLLPSQSPQPLIVSSAVDPSAPPVAEPSTKVRFPGKRVTMPEMRKRARTVLDFVTKVQVEMVERQRRWDLLRDVNERVRDARERQRVGRSSGGAVAAGEGSANGVGSGAASSGSRDSSVVAQPRGVGGTTPVPGASATATAALGALPPLPGGAGGEAAGGVELSSAPSTESALLMDALAKEVVQFQQRFFGIVE
ncbi:putative transcription factor binding protein [Rhodotorula diobovata]|uniref:Putative transcription factor binding protein n=1 Tax=Rhodotorula diobovata TaxID=5288 RepID=A0A5C5FU90_9BASI|nr:putative transcription factor binding protein [Rhodotorula diobovata]